MPIVSIKTVKGLLNHEKKVELHKRITELMVEIEGGGNKKFAKFVVVDIKEEPAENFSGGGMVLSPQLLGIQTSEE